MKKKLTIAAIILAVVLLITAVIVFYPRASVDRKVIENNPLIGSQAPEYQEGEVSFAEEGYTVIGETSDLKLMYNDKDYTIKVVNTKTGYEWSSLITDEDYINGAQYGSTENSEEDRQNFRKLFELSYTNYDQLDLSTSLATEPYATVKHHKLKNGIALESTFPSCEITVTFEMWLDNSGLNVRIPKDKIVESGVNGVVNVSVLPMFGATTDDKEDAFALFPDSTGTIYDIKKVENAQNPVLIDVYFPQSFDLDKIQENNEQGIKNAMLPYYGISRDNNAFIAYITEGEMNSHITLNPSGAIYNLTRVNPSINYRKSYSYTNPSGEIVTTIEREITAGDFAAHYMLLGNGEEKVSYGDMANTLRDFLVESKRLTKAQAATQESVKVNLQMIMSTKVETMIAEYLQVMTSADDIKNVINGMPEKNADALRLMVLGWQSSGYNVYPSSGKAAREIGNIKGLSKFLKEKGIESYFVDDFVYASTDSEYFSVQDDAVYNEARLPVTDSENKKFVRNPFAEFKNLTKNLLPYLKKNEVNGIGFDKIGWYVFDDYQKNMSLTREDVISVYTAMMKEAKENGFMVANQRGNSYILNNTDYLYDLPVSGSTYEQLDRDIPFYQLVVHGYIPYSMDIPGNMSVDYEREILRWIEFGAEPTFLLTQEMSEKFKDSKVENAFSTELSTWIDDVQKLAEEFNKNFAFTSNCTISDHEEVSKDVFCTTYSNGKKVYVNYNSNDVTVNDITVKALGYKVADGSIAG